MSELPDELMVRLRQIVSGGKVTEAELRAVAEQADGLARSLDAHVEGSERRLGELSRDPDSSLAEAAAELRRVEAFRPALLEVRGLLVALDQRARELRTEWLLHQAADAGGPGEAAVVTRPAVP
jgi:signal transduction histidine kinase